MRHVGGKAKSLQQLVAAGFDVPSFKIVAPDETLSTSQLLEIGPGPYAIRSSGADEDSAGHSHAGQYLTLLSIEAADVSNAIERVRGSAARISAQCYRAQQGLEKDRTAIPVIVQQMLSPRIAGVMFTADPVGGRRDRLVLSATAGLAERLVSGEIDGETTLLDRDGKTLESAGELLKMSDRAALHAAGLEIEKLFRAPQDVEWAFEGDRLFLLQSRPITTPLRPLPHLDQTLQVFDNSNIVESYPGVVSPLTYSFAQYVYARVYRRFVALLGVPDAKIAANADIFDNMLSRRDGRVYYNLVNWYRALALLPGFSINRSYMETMMGVDEPLPKEISDRLAPPPVQGLAKLSEWLRLARTGFGIVWEAINLGRTRRGFEARLNESLALPVHKLDSMPLTELAAEYRRIEASLIDQWDAPLVNDFLCMIGFGASRKMMERWGGQQAVALHNDVMIGQGDIISAEPAQRIKAMADLIPDEDMRKALERGDGSNLDRAPELGAAVEAYLAKFADRCAEELKLESVTLDRDPSSLYRAIAAAQFTNPAPLQNELELKDCISNPLWRFTAQHALAWTKARVRDRENLRFQRTRVFGRARRLFGAIGVQFHAHGLLDSPDDVFNLSVHEVLGAIEGFSNGDDLSALAALRGAELARAIQREDPPERIEIRGASVLGLSSREAPAKTAKNDGADERERSGTGCGAGIVSAQARVIKDPHNETLRQGQVLVARHTDPGWIALFANASAIVVERGSLLSHSAIVARELGIPCVVGLKGATVWIADGETIHVDGASGRVERLL